MARLIVVAEPADQDESRVLMDERVMPEHLTDDHEADQLVERIGWAVIDAEGQTPVPPG